MFSSPSLGENGYTFYPFQHHPRPPRRRRPPPLGTPGQRIAASYSNAPPKPFIASRTNVPTADELFSAFGLDPSVDLETFARRKGTPAEEDPVCYRRVGIAVVTFFSCLSWISLLETAGSTNASWFSASYFCEGRGMHGGEMDLDLSISMGWKRFAVKVHPQLGVGGSEIHELTSSSIRSLAVGAATMNYVAAVVGIFLTLGLLFGGAGTPRKVAVAVAAGGGVTAAVVALLVAFVSCIGFAMSVTGGKCGDFANGEGMRAVEMVVKALLGQGFNWDCVVTSGVSPGYALGITAMAASALALASGVALWEGVRLWRLGQRGSEHDELLDEEKMENSGSRSTNSSSVSSTGSQV
ncbi:unnamed protein product [Discosporangium mesarthrocarpum]